MVRRIAKVTGLLTVVLLSTTCTESVGPRNRSLDTPLFSYSASGITLDRDIQTFSESGRLLIKGFNPKNPHVGDAIIATFSWLGSTNIIDSVVDVVTTNPYTRVGNTYTLVQYVTAGGLSMATYVATNAQNFPDTSTDPNKILAIGAYLRDSVADGGVRLTSWLGVDDVFSQALGSGTGAPRSASGSGTTPTVASAGPISFNPGALVYAVSAEKPPVGVDRDPAYTTVSGAASDGVIKDDAVYSVGASGGTANPQWTWYFDQQPGGGMWLATSLTLNAAATSGNQPPVAAFSSSCSALTCNFTSTSSDPDGSIASYSWTFGDGGTSTVQNPSHSYAAAGSYTVTLTVTDNQGATNSVSHSVTVTAANQPPVAAFSSSCNALTCNFTSTSSDPDGSIASYSWTFGDGGTSTAQNPSHTYAAGGTYTVTLRVTDNQGAQSTTTSKTVTVTAPNQAPVVNAGPDDQATTGLLYSFTWSFTDANHNGPWSYTINWGDGSTSSGTVSSEGSFSAGHTYIIILPRSFTITVTVRDAAGASTSDTKVVSVLLL